MAATTFDPGTVEVIRNYYASAAREMQRTLVRTAYNTVVYNALDFGISIYDRDLNLVADNPGLSLFLGANDYAIERVVEYVGEENFEPGDILITNYPYWSSAHALDVCLSAPIFHDDELVGFGVIRAHWLDLGQKDSGYVLDSTTVHQEGVLFPATKVYSGGEPNEQILDLIRFNSRLPEKVIGDLNAQVAAIETGRRRIEELYDKYGPEVVEQAVEQILTHGERKARDAVADLPDGSWSAVDYLDNDGVNDEPVRMEIEVTIDGDEFTVDFSGSSDETEGPINVMLGRTEAICKLCLKTLTSPEELSNGGQYEPLSVVAPEGNLFNAQYPAPTFTLWSSIAAVDVVFKSLAEGMPERVPAGSGSDVCSIMFVGTDPDTDRMFVEGENAGVGWGAGVDHDGGNAQIHISQTMLQGMPVEMFESKAPIRIRRTELRADSGGAGEYRGGLGIRRDYELLEGLRALAINKKTRYPSWPLSGGESGARNGVRLSFDGEWSDRVSVLANNSDLYDDADDRVVWTGMMYGEFEPGEVISNRSGGGGGYGDPFERPPKQVREDVRDGYVSREAAREDYGVAITEEGQINRRETDRLRD